MRAISADAVLDFAEASHEFEVENHEGSLTAKTAVGRNMPWRGSKFVPGGGTPYIYVKGCI